MILHKFRPDITLIKNYIPFLYKVPGQSPAFLSYDYFVRSNEIVRTKWLIYQVIGHLVLMI